MDSGAFLLQVYGWYLGAAAVAVIDVGHRVGLFDALAEAPASSVELAARTGLSERHVREWLAASATAHITEYDAPSSRFSLPGERAAVLSGPSASNVAGLAQSITFISGFGSEVAQTLRDGGGIPYRTYGPELAAIQDGINRRVYDAVLVDGYIAAVEGLCDRLEAGVALLDVGCGSGHVLNLLGRAFPASTFVGFDASERAIDQADGEAKEYGLTNVTFEVHDVAVLPNRARFDVVTAFDAIHDQAHPRRVLREIQRVLAPDGLFVMVDMNASSSLEENLRNPIAGYLYWVSLFHCMQVSLAEGGEGLGAAWGVERAESLLREAGFSTVKRVPAPASDPVNVIFVCQS